MQPRERRLTVAKPLAMSVALVQVRVHPQLTPCRGEHLESLIAAQLWRHRPHCERDRVARCRDQRTCLIKNARPLCHRQAAVRRKAYFSTRPRILGLCRESNHNEAANARLLERGNRITQLTKPLLPVTEACLLYTSRCV